MISAVAKWLISCRIVVAFTQHVLPRIRFTWAHTRISGRQYKRGYKLLRPGHIIVSTDENRASTMFTPGEWGHAAQCVAKGPSEDFEIGEMHAEGFNKVTFFDICHTSDRVAILECADYDDAYVQEIIAECKALSLIKVLYDFVFSTGSKELYCSEMIVAIDKKNRLKNKITETMLGMVITPDDIYKSDNVRVVWDSDE